MIYTSLLQTVQTFCQRRGITVPAVVMGSTDDQIIQIRALLEEGCDDIARRGAWEGLTWEAAWTTSAAENQGEITSLAPNLFNYLKPETLWDRTEMLPLLGPLDSQDWQALKAINVTGPRYSFRIWRDRFYVTPTPPAGHSWVFEYVSEGWVIDSLGTTVRTGFLVDSDQIVLPRPVVNMDLSWRWKKEKGLPYAEDFNSCERLIADALGRDAGKPVLKMDNCGDSSIMPGIFVPSGNWPV